ncbi:hypothetical protein ACVWXN_004862 [Bradyrhizobium sp. i1.4.4]
MAGGELDRERDAIEPTADVADVRRVRIRQSEPTSSCGRAFHEELYGGVGNRALGRQNGVFRRACQRREAICVLAFDPQQLPARGHDVQLRCLLVEPFGQRRRGVDDMLAAIQNEQHPPVAQECNKTV